MKRRIKSNDLLSVDKVACFLGISERTVWRYDKAGKLPQPLIIGGVRYWHKTDLRLWIDWEKPSRKVFGLIKEKG